MVSKPNKTRRLFYALWPDDEIRGKLLVIQKRLNPQTGRQVHPQDLHMTLQFLGSVSDEQFDCVAAVGEKLADSRVFRLRLDRLGYWQRSKTLWLSPDETPEILLELVKRMGEQLAGCGFEAENRRFKPHVTLARKQKQTQIEQILDPVDWQVDTIALVESFSDPQPPHYQPLIRWQLKNS